MIETIWICYLISPASSIIADKDIDWYLVWIDRSSRPAPLSQISRERRFCRRVRAWAAKSGSCIFSPVADNPLTGIWTFI